MDEGVSLGDLAEEDAEAVLVALARVFQELPDGAGAEGVLAVAQRIAEEEDLNALRLMRENPGLTLELVGVDPDFSDAAVERFDELADA